MLAYGQRVDRVSLLMGREWTECACVWAESGWSVLAYGQRVDGVCLLMGREWIECACLWAESG